MTTITPDPGNRNENRRNQGPSLRESPHRPGTLTAVPHADQSQTSQKDAPVTYPGAPRPDRLRPTPLGELADRLGVETAGSGDVTGITHDSRAVRPGDVYAALPGARMHGADFAAQAAGLGAVAVLTDPTGAERAAATGLPVLVTENPRAVMGELAADIYGRPGIGLLQIGITGTSGKTTTAYLVEGGLRAAGRPTGLIGTVEMRIGDERIKSERTTPEATDLQALFAVMRERGVEAAAMESPATPWCSARVDGCVFDVALSSTTSARSTWSSTPAWRTTSRPRPSSSPPSAATAAWSTSTTSTAAGSSPSPASRHHLLRRGPPDADWHAEDVEVGPQDSTFTAVGPKGERITARARRCPARSTSPTPSPRSSRWPSRASTRRSPPTASPPSPGSRAGWSGWTPDSPTRRRRLRAQDRRRRVRPALPRKVTEGKVRIVLGCGGDRDTTKRGPMGAAAARLADTAVLTSDNPRSEDPLAILAAMLSGAAEVPCPRTRRRARRRRPGRRIAAAVARAEPGDTVLVAGKGHEQGQDVHGVVRAFDDRKVLHAAIERSLAHPGADAPSPREQQSG